MVCRMQSLCMNISDMSHSGRTEGWKGMERTGQDKKGKEQREEKTRKDNTRKDCAFWRQFNEKPNMILGCPGNKCVPFG